MIYFRSPPPGLKSRPPERQPARIHRLMRPITAGRATRQLLSTLRRDLIVNAGGGRILQEVQTARGPALTSPPPSIVRAIFNFSPLSVPVNVIRTVRPNAFTR